MLCGLVVVSILLLITLTRSFIIEDKYTLEDRYEEVTTLNRSEVRNLFDIDPTTGREFAHSFVAEIPEYNVAVDFTFPDKFSPDFIQENITHHELSRFGMETPSVTVIYFSDSTDSEIEIELTVFDSAREAQEAWVNFIFLLSSPRISPAEANGIVVGDVAYGDDSWLTFIRGNIHVDISSNTSIVAVAQELDAQIIAALEVAERNPFHRRPRILPQSTNPTYPEPPSDIPIEPTNTNNKNVFGDEEIIAARVATRAASMLSIDKIVHIDGVNYTFSQREISPAFSMVMPENFDTIDDTLSRMKYPHDNRADIILSNQDTTVSMAFDSMVVEPKELNSRLKEYKWQIKKPNPNNVFFSESILSLPSGLSVACFDYLGTAIDDDIYYFNFFTDLPDGELFGSFSCPARLQKEWEPLVRQMIQTIKPLQR